MRLLALALLTVVVALPVFATDGVVEINQTCAVNTGCFPGDSAGFPVTISSPGSYILTGTLFIIDPGADGIRISADNVSINVNGFSLVGPGSGSGNGIIASGSRTVVRNGFVEGFGNAGIETGPHSLVRDCHLIDNGTGLQLGSGTGYVGNNVQGNGTGVSGGRALGGNLCDDGTCSRVPKRRFYDTTGEFTGSQVLTACTQGFHMASIWEILDPSNLAYATELGRQASDSGSGPPNTGGWARTGFGSIASGNGANCLAWTSSNFAERGTSVSLDGVLDDGIAHDAPPWRINNILPCNLSAPVWCIED